MIPGVGVPRQSKNKLTDLHHRTKCQQRPLCCTGLRRCPHPTHVYAGSKRRKESGILTNRPDIFGNLVRQCDGNHVHEKWGPMQDPLTGKWLFATGQECEYHTPFCECLAQCLADHYGTIPRRAPADRTKRPKPRQSKLRTRAQVGFRSKSLNSLCFVPERKPPSKNRVEMCRARIFTPWKSFVQD